MRQREQCGRVWPNRQLRGGGAPSWRGAPAECSQPQRLPRSVTCASAAPPHTFNSSLQESAQVGWDRRAPTGPAGLPAGFSRAGPQQPAVSSLPACLPICRRLAPASPSPPPPPAVPAAPSAEPAPSRLPTESSPLLAPASTMATSTGREGGIPGTGGQAGAAAHKEEKVRGGPALHPAASVGAPGRGARVGRGGVGCGTGGNVMVVAAALAARPGKVCHALWALAFSRPLPHSHLRTPGHPAN